MSFSRFSDAPVYTFIAEIDGRDEICCCACSISEGDFSSPSPIEFLGHLEAHAEAGDEIPEWLLAAIALEDDPVRA